MIRLSIEKGKLFFNGNEIEKERLFWNNKKLSISKIDDLYLLKLTRSRCNCWVSLIHREGEYWLEKHSDYLPAIQNKLQDNIMRPFINILRDYGISLGCVILYQENEFMPVWKNNHFGIDCFHNGTDNKKMLGSLIINQVSGGSFAFSFISEKTRKKVLRLCLRENAKPFDVRKALAKKLL